MRTTFKCGDIVRFNAGNTPYHVIEQGGFTDVEYYNGRSATIEYLQTTTEIGNKNKEWYTIQFFDGMIWYGVPGSYLKKTASRKKVIISLIIFIVVLLVAMFGESLIDLFLKNLYGY